jgi:hypothetical protein
VPCAARSLPEIESRREAVVGVEEVVVNGAHGGGAHVGGEVGAAVGGVAARCEECCGA